MGRVSKIGSLDQHMVAMDGRVVEGSCFNESMISNIDYMRS